MSLLGGFTLSVDLSFSILELVVPLGTYIGYLDLTGEANFVYTRFPIYPVYH